MIPVKKPVTDKLPAGPSHAFAFGLDPFMQEAILLIQTM